MVRKRKLIFELQNLLGNMITLIFGFAFAPMMALVFGSSYSHIPQALNQLYLSFFCTIPLSMVFVGFGSLFSQEMEQGFTLRAELLGYSRVSQAVHKFISLTVFVLLSSVLYSWIFLSHFDLSWPSWSIIIQMAVFQVLNTAVYFMIVFILTIILKKFSRVYGISMISYFGIMIVCNIMGNLNIGKLGDYLPIKLFVTNYTNHLSDTGYISGKIGLYLIILLIILGVVMKVVVGNKNEHKHQY
ncbi:hypothetical protein GCM10025879_07660 [Leuconostoc litchii]|uniref:ABC transporter permease n=1 Tax=Leuconostoc litchii TaxID=1981069 RepID=A0A6P2CN77_9LACO|nr:hypothetical protein [Leuconostoc litchii]TYC47495.1 hypothetical protein ESZ47_04970 [Leuconostoc litchii]GMA69520.1 hypothetical protein GCM10025879_07660 [Leuconostoc litchii]